MNDEKMQKIIALAIKKAEEAFQKGEIPVAAVIFHLETGEVIAATANDNGKKSNATNHAEMLAIAKASEKVGNRYLSEYGIFVTLEPCPMCAAAISFAKIPLLLFGAEDEKGGGVFHGARIYETQKNLFIPKVEGGIEKEKCATLLKKFFKNMREAKNGKA